MKRIEQFTGTGLLPAPVCQQLDRNLQTLATEGLVYSITNDYALSDSDQIASLQVDATNGNVTIVLPSPTGKRTRRIIKTDSSANLVTISAGNYTINGSSTYVLHRTYRFVEVEPTGSGWVVVNWGGVFVNGSADAFAGNGVLATTATTGFLYVPTCAGAPTGVPAGFGAYVPLVVDTTNHKLYFYDGTWRDAGP